MITLLSLHYTLSRSAQLCTNFTEKIFTVCRKIFAGLFAFLTMKQGILKRSTCDYYYHEKFMQSVSFCKVIKIQVFCLFQEITKLLQDIVTISDCVIENITSVLQCLNKVEESLKCSLKMQKKLFLHKEGDYCKYFSIIFTFSIMFKNVPVL